MLNLVSRSPSILDAVLQVDRNSKYVTFIPTIMRYFERLNMRFIKTILVEISFIKIQYISAIMALTCHGLGESQ